MSLFCLLAENRYYDLQTSGVSLTYTRRTTQYERLAIDDDKKSSLVGQCIVAESSNEEGILIVMDMLSTATIAGIELLPSPNCCGRYTFFNVNICKLIRVL